MTGASLHTSSAPDKSDTVLLVAEGIGKTFPGSGGFLRRRSAPVFAVNNASLTVSRGETVGIVGESGSGKTTLARIIAGLEEPTTGTLRLRVDGELKPITRRNRAEELAFRRRVQMVFQDPFSAMNPRHRVGDAFHEPLKVHGIVSKTERAKIIDDVLNTVEMGGTDLTRFPHEFSGGQRQRLSIARALSLSPELLILDESVSALDVSIQAQVLNLLKSIQRDLQMTFLFIGHDLSVVKYMSDSVLVMHHGDVVEHLPAAELLLSTHPYTRRLIDAIPSPILPPDDTTKDL